MPRIFGILRNKDSARPNNHLERAVERAGLRRIGNLGPAIFLALGEDCEIIEAVDRDRATAMIIRPPAPSQSFRENTAPAHSIGSTYNFDPASYNGPFTSIESATDGRQVISIDRFGQHRLAYARITSGEVVFASDIGLLRCHPEVSFRLDNQAIYNYLFFHVVPSPGSIFTGISKLPPAHRLEFDGSNCRISRYWTPHFANTLSEPVERTKETVVPTVIDAVGRCGVGPETGAFLSGGLDSSTVCGALQSIQTAAAKVFSVGFAAEGYDEIHFAEAAARHFGLDHHVHYITPQEVVDAVPRVARAYDEPFGNSSAVPTLVCAEFARSHEITRLLAGDGGDEIFSGNTRYRKQKLFESYFAVPKLLRSKVIQPLFATSGETSKLGKGPLRKITRYVDQALVPLPDRLESHNLMQMVALADMLEPEFIASIDVDQPFELMRREWNALEGVHYQDKMLFLDWKLTLADNDLRKVTEMTRLGGVEVCYPLLDNHVVELATSIPAATRMPDGKLRHFYREAVRTFLPKETLSKTKHGFGLPFGEWARTDPGLRDVTMDALAALRGRRIIRESFLSRLQRQHMEEHAGFYGNMVWVLMMLELWLDEHDLTV
jgi:asparagine synthase (glutamine-hydrolysing)